MHGTSAITAITAQNTLGVDAVHLVPAHIVLAQVRAVARDIGVDAVKVGMLGDADVILAVATALDELPAGTPVVVDPVMIAESGARLLALDAHRALVHEIVPRASVLTPNVPEARALVARDGEADADSDADADVEPAADAEPDADADADADAAEDAEIERLAREVLALGAGAVVLTGGHRARAIDVFVDSREPDSAVAIAGPRHPDGAAHGSGCTHASLLAARLALGDSPLEAARFARRMAAAAVERGLRELGGGAGPVDVLDLARMRRS